MPNHVDAIRNIQTYLRQLSEFNENIPLVPLDGVYGSATREAVEAFQANNRLPVTGVVDSITWTLLYDAYLDSRAQHASSRSISPFPPFPLDYAIAMGEESELVWMLHHILRTLSHDYDDLDDIPDGLRFTPRTDRAVRSMQTKHALPQTGQVDRATWNALAEAYDRSVHSTK